MMVKTSKRMLLNKDRNILMPLKIVRCSGNEVEGDHDKIDYFNSDEGNDDSSEATDQQIFRKRASAPKGLYLTPLRATGIRSGIMSALKITAERIAEVGECSC